MNLKPSKANLCENSLGKKWKSLVSILNVNKIFKIPLDFYLILTENDCLKLIKYNLVIYLTYEDNQGFNVLSETCFPKIFNYFEVLNGFIYEHKK